MQRANLSFTLAHFSDLHLGPLPRGAAYLDFAWKRFIGAANWNFSRHKIHDPKLATALINDIRNFSVDHAAFTGDLVNIAAKSEFTESAKWLRGAGRSDWLSFVPGNHDAYVPINWEHGLGHFAANMTSDMQIPNAATSSHIAAPFPQIGSTCDYVQKQSIRR